MTKRDFFKTELLKDLESKIKDFGFQLNKKQVEFIKKNELGWFKYQIVFFKINEGWELKPCLLIRCNTVENIFHEISEFEVKYQKDTPTIGSSIEDYLNDNISYRYRLTDENQIKSIAQQLYILFKTVALPFFAKYNTIDKIDNVLNSNIQDASLTGAIFKGSKALITAKLTNRDNYQELENYYLNYYSTFSNGFYLPSYLNLVNLLKTL